MKCVRAALMEAHVVSSNGRMFGSFRLAIEWPSDAGSSPAAAV